MENKTTEEVMEVMHFTQDDLERVCDRVSALGEEMGFDPLKFSVIIAMVARYLTEEQGIEVTAEKKLDS